MNLMSRDINYKKWFIIIGSVLVLVLVIVALLFNEVFDDTSKPSDTNKDNPISKTDNTGVGGFSGGEGVFFGDNVTSDDVFHPTIKQEGKLLKVVNRGTYANLVVSSGKKRSTYKFTPSSIIYDADSRKVVLPSRMEASSNVTIYSLPESEVAGQEKKAPSAELVVLGGRREVEYAPVTSVNSTAKGAYVINTLDKVKYKLPKNPKIRNAFTGYYLTTADIKQGDGVFVYTGKALKSDAHEPINTEGTVLPKELKPKKLDKIDYSLIEDYDTRSVREIIVYPFNR